AAKRTRFMATPFDKIVKIQIRRRLSHDPSCRNCRAVGFRSFYELSLASEWSCDSSPLSGFGGFLPYFASYWAANSASFSGWHAKHCESGRSCSLHQSPLALKSATSFTWHKAQTFSGTPCSSHHQPLCECSPAVCVAASGCDASGLAQPTRQPTT